MGKAFRLEDLEHGEWRRYERGCRCEPCGLAWFRYLKLNRHGLSPRRWVSPDSAVAHINELRARGMGSRAIAQAAGIQLAQVSRIRRGITTKIWLSTERRILAVPLQPLTLPARGTLTRLKALEALGHTQTWINLQLGHGAVGVSCGQGRQVFRTTAEEVIELMRRVGDRPGPSLRTRNRALKAGWLPPAAYPEELFYDVHWDGAWTPEARVPGEPTALEVDILFLREQGARIDQIAARLRCSRGRIVDVIAAATARAESATEEIVYNELTA